MMLARTLTGLGAADVVIAGVVFGESPGSAARWIVAGLAAYGAAAFIHAIAASL